MALALVSMLNTRVASSLGVPRCAASQRCVFRAGVSKNSTTYAAITPSLAHAKGEGSTGSFMGIDTVPDLGLNLATGSRYTISFHEGSNALYYLKNGRVMEMFYNGAENKFMYKLLFNASCVASDRYSQEGKGSSSSICGTPSFQSIRTTSMDTDHPLFAMDPSGQVFSRCRHSFNSKGRATIHCRSLGADDVFESGDCSSRWMPLGSGLLLAPPADSDFVEPALPSHRTDSIYFLTKGGGVLARRRSYGGYGEWTRFDVPEDFRPRVLTDVHTVHEHSVFAITSDGRLVEFDEKGRDQESTWHDHGHPTLKSKSRRGQLAAVEGLAYLSSNKQDSSLFLLTKQGDLVEWQTKFHKSFKKLFGFPRWLNHESPANSRRLFSPVSGMVAGKAFRIFVTSLDGRVHEWRMPSFDLERRSHGWPAVFKKQWVDHGIPGDTPVQPNTALSVTKFGIFAHRQDGQLARLYIKNQKLIRVKISSGEGHMNMATVPKTEM